MDEDNVAQPAVKHLAVCLLAITILAAGLRGHGLAVQSLGNDELATWLVANAPGLSDVLAGMHKDVHLPAYYLLMNVSIRLLGDSEAALRIPSVFLGVLCIPLIFFLGRRLYSHREGLIAASLMAMLWLPVYFSQEASPYALLMVATLLSIVALLRVCRQIETSGKPRLADVLASGASAALCAYTHFFGLLFVLLQATATGVYYLVLRQPRRLLWAAAPFGLATVLFMPWLPTLIQQLAIQRTYPRRDLSYFFTYLRFNFNESYLLAGFAFGLLFAAGVRSIDREVERSGVRAFLRSLLLTPGFALVMWFVLPFLIAFVVDRVARPILLKRFLTFCAPAAYLLVARALAQLGISSRFRQLTLAGLMLCLCWHLIVYKQYYSKPVKEQNRELAEYIVEKNRSYSKGQVVPCVNRLGYLDYYLRQLGSDLTLDGTRFRKRSDLDALERLLTERDPDHVWLAYALVEPHESLLAYLRGKYSLVEHHELVRAGVYWFSTREGAEAAAKKTKGSKVTSNHVVDAVSHSTARAPGPEQGIRVFRWPPEAVASARARIASGETSLESREVVKLIEWAEESLSAGPFSVLDKTTVPPSGDKHDYWSQAAYWWPDPSTEDGIPYIRKDGQHNPEWKTSIADSYRLKTMAWAVERLALAFYLLDREEYARHATHLLRVWFLAPETRMNPHLTYAQTVPGRAEEGRSLGIIDSLHLTHVVDAIGLLAFSKAWTEDDQRGMEAWFGAYLDWLLTSDRGAEERGRINNHGTYIDVQMVSYALFLGKNDLARKILELAKSTRIEQAIEPDGRQPSELRRTRSFKYCVYNLRGLFDLATMGEHVGVDLWRFRTDDGRGIRKALDFVMPYADPQQHWPHQEISSRVVTRNYLMRLLRRAAIVYQEDAYERLVKEHATSRSLNHLHLLLYPSPTNR